jgi:TnpA family transposase
MTSDRRRLTILTDDEIDGLYGLPRFSEEDRLYYFNLSPAEHEVLSGASRIGTSVIHLVLQIGYFKAKQQFFIYSEEEVADDVLYIAKRHFPDRNPASIDVPSKPTRLAQQRLILQLFGYRSFDAVTKVETEIRAQRAAKLSTQPIYILRELLHYLSTEKVVAPGYTTLQDIVSMAVTRERKRITELLDSLLIPSVKERLDELLEQADDGMYHITGLKHEPKDFSYKELRQEVARRKSFQPIHEFARNFLEMAELSKDSVRYYASLVQFYTVYKLCRMDRPTARLYLLCFAFHSFRQINDNLIEAFIHLVDGYEQDAKKTAEEAERRSMIEASRHLKAAGHVLDLFIDQDILDGMPFAEVRARAFFLLDEPKFPIVSKYMRNIEFDKTGREWDSYTSLSMRFKRNLRHLFIDLEFAGRVDSPLMESITFMQSLLQRGVSPVQADPTRFPTEIIPKSLQCYLFEPGEDEKTKRLNVDRYEFLVYRMLRNALEAGDVYVKDSNEFRRFEDDLITDARWQDKERILHEIGSPVLIAPIEETLANLREELETKFKTVNQRIENGENKHIKISRKGEQSHWTLVYPSEEDPAGNAFYDQLPGISIVDLLWFATEKTEFTKSCTHILDRYVKQEPDLRTLLACIIAMGTNMGLWKMAEVSGISHGSLMTTARNYLRVETLHAMNDVICNAIAALPVFHLHDIQGKVHSSSDGQRLEAQIHTINARHGSKYFGLKKGVSGYTLVANHVPINAKIIGTHEHESHYVYDILFNNTTDIKPVRHSTDTHGTNQVNSWILYVFGCYFAPRYRDLHKKMGRLVGFERPGHYANYLIKPARKVNEELIIREWSNVQRIMVSLAQKDVTQATIVRKLSSYERQNQTKKALWELDSIISTLHILTIIDDVEMRQCMQKALNRGEAYHRLRRAISYVNSGKFKVKSESEQQIWNECSRLIANAIIYYNAALLSRVYEQKQAVGDEAAIAFIKGVSLLAWQHVNLFGKFDFGAEMGVDLEGMAACFNDPNCWNRVLNNNPS